MAKKNKSKVHIILSSASIVFLLAIGTTVHIGMNSFPQAMDLVFGKANMNINKAEGSENWDSDYYHSTYDQNTVEEKAKKLTEEIMNESIVLLKNKDNAFPLHQTNEKEKKINVFGWSFTYPAYGGTGSGAASTSKNITPLDGLKNAGFEVNQNLLDTYKDWSNNTTRLTNNGTKKNNVRPTLTYSNAEWDLPEMPLNEKIVNDAKSFSDVALVYLTRIGGENYDVPLHMGDDTFYASNKTKNNTFGYNPNKHYLELSDEEEAMIEQIKNGGFTKICIIINSSNPMELGNLKNDEKINSILYIGGPGSTGFNSVGKILNGEVNPSGKTADIFPCDFTLNPSYTNFGDDYYYNPKGTDKRRNKYTNINNSNTYLNQGYFVQYEEGIYVGYRYYETAFEYGSIDYNKEVAFPFGYGLSYTTFSQKITKHDSKNGKISLDVEVENTGKVAGKDVVEIYYRAPYGKEETGNPVETEKSSKVLIAFDKTKIISPGEKDTLHLDFNIEDMASFDNEFEGCYVLDKGEYNIYLGQDSHNVYDSFTYYQNQKEIYNENNPRQSEINAQGKKKEDTIAAMSVFDDELIDSEIMKMDKFSRKDKLKDLPKAPTDRDRIASNDLIAALTSYDVSKDDINENATEPIFSNQNGYSLIDLRAKEYDNPLYDSLLNQMSKEEMIKLVSTGGWQTAEVSSVGKPKSSDNDGPQALKVNDWAGVSGKDSLTLNGFPSEAIIACSWNQKLVEEWGSIVGEEGLAYGVTGWYGPGANIHRSPFGGRNFEYFSEDPLLSGKLLSSLISKASEKGLVCYTKHFALNDQESYRSGWVYYNFSPLFTWVDEQAAREIYLKAFEIPLKEATMEVEYIANEDGNHEKKVMRAATALMSSFNAIGTTWTGGCKSLLKSLLRDEWGFKGTVITDYRSDSRSFMNIDKMVRNGGDLVLSTTNAKFKDEDSNTSMQALRDASHNILYSFANSNLMNKIVPGSIITYDLAPWQVGIYIGWGVIGITSLTLSAWIVFNFIKLTKINEGDIK